MITIHGRTREDHYGVPPDFAAMAEAFTAARAVGGPDLVLTGNGDVFDPVSAHRLLNETGCDAVLVSRGALGNPWIFQQILDPTALHPRTDEWFAVLRRHLDYHITHYGDTVHAVACFRKHLLWYAAGFPRMRRMRDALSTVSSVAEIERLIDEGMRDTDPQLRRFATEQNGDGRHQTGTFDPKFDMDRRHDQAVANESAG